jgi:hypothetical protein
MHMAALIVDRELAMPCLEWLPKHAPGPAHGKVPQAASEYSTSVVSESALGYLDFLSGRRFRRLRLTVQMTRAVSHRLLQLKRP